ncbi:MAG: restriction endonuclease subunit S [Candidatus Electrothrix sp. GW3-4]|uniref:restriction endonuclease subunit S n=1 Tax=Candidatus Electrothrix sp. GW3-4 TaxID=3126740 RepID=UPI0030D49577
MKPYPRYKDSGVEWIGEVPEHWDSIKLKYLFRWEKGTNAASYTNSYISHHSGEYPVYSGQTENNGILGHIESFDYDFENIILFVTTVGAKAMSLKRMSGRFSLSQNCALIIPHDIKITCSSYYFYFLQRLFSYEKNAISLIMQPSLRFEDLNQYSVFSLSHSEQTTIAAYLDRKTAEIDNLIANKERLIELYEEKKQAVINEAVTKGLNPDAEMKDSGVEWLGEIPKHWDAIKLKLCISSIDQGWSPQCEAQQADNNEWGILKVGCVNGEHFDSFQNKKLPDALPPRLQCKIQQNDIIVSRANIRDLVGLAALVEEDYPNILLCDKLFRFRSRDNIANAKFLVYYIRSSTSRMQIEERATGASSSMQNISQSVIKDLCIALPPLDEQISIVAHIVQKMSLIDQIITRTKRGINLFKEYRTALISEAVTGKIDVRDAG